MYRTLKIKKKIEEPTESDESLLNKFSSQLSFPKKKSQIIIRTQKEKPEKKQLLSRPSSNYTLSKPSMTTFSSKLVMKAEPETFYYRPSPSLQIPFISGARSQPNLFNIRQQPILQNGKISSTQSQSTFRKLRVPKIEFKQEYKPLPPQDIKDVKIQNFLDWSDEASNYLESDAQIDQEKSQIKEASPIDEADQKEQRLNFLQQMLQNQVDDQRKKQLLQDKQKQQEEEKVKEKEIVDQHNHHFPFKIQKQLDRSKSSNNVSGNNLTPQTPKQVFEDENVSYKEKIVIRLQAYARAKLGVLRYRKQKEQRVIQLKRQKYDQAVRKIQLWMRKTVYNLRMRELTRKQYQKRKCSRYPKREEKASIVIQGFARSFLVRKNQKFKVPEIIVRLSFIELTFYDEFKRIVPQKFLWNRLFWFRCSVNNITVKLRLLPYEKRKCLKIYKQGFTLEFKIEQFCRILVMLDQYIEFQHNSIEEDVNITNIIEIIYTLSMHQLYQIRVNGDIEYEFQKNNSYALQRCISKIAPYLEKLIRIEENKEFILLGFTDYMYNQKYQPPKTQETLLRDPPLSALHKISYSITLQIIRIQKYIKGLIQRRQLEHILARSQQDKILREFTVMGKFDGETQKEYFHIWIYCDSKRTRIPWVVCRSESLKKISNKLEINESVTKQIGEPNRENFFEIYLVEKQGRKIILSWSDEGQYWVNRENYTGGKKKNRITLKKLVAAAIKIQKMIRRCLFINHLKIVYIIIIILLYKIKEKKKRLQQFVTNYERVSLVKKITLQQFSSFKKGYYLNFFLLTEKKQLNYNNQKDEIQNSSEQNENQSSISQIQGKLIKQKKLHNFLTFMSATVLGSEQQEQQSIQIFCKCLEHNRLNIQKVQPFIQKLFYHIPQTEIIGIAQMMLEQAIIEPAKQSGFMRLKVINLEELQGMIINRQQNKLQGKNSKDDSLEARRIFNNTTQRHKQLFQNNSIFQYIPTSQLHTTIQQLKSNSRDQGHQYKSHWEGVQNYASMIWKSWKIHSTQNKQYINQTKIIKYQDLDSIAEYVRNVKNISEYGYGENLEQGMHNINFIDEMKEQEEYQKQMEIALIAEQQRKKEQILREETEKRQKIRLTQRMIYQDYCVISTFRVYLIVIYNKLIEQLTITTQLDDLKPQDQNEQQIYKILIDKSQLVPGIYVDEEYLKSQVEQLIIKQLHQDDDGLYFVPDVNTQQIFYEQYNKYQKEQDYIKMITALGEQGLTQKKLNIMVQQQNNFTKSIQKILQELEFQVIRLAVYQRQETIECEYLYNLSDDSIIIQITLISDLKIKKIYRITQSSLQSGILMNQFKSKTPEEIIKQFQPFIDSIEQLLDITYDQTQSQIKTNYYEFKIHLSQMFQEQYLKRLQNKSRAILSVRQLKIRKNKSEGKNKQIYLARQIQNFEGRYIDMRFYLFKKHYKIRFSIQEMNSIDGKGNITSIKRVQGQESERMITLNKFIYDFNLLELMERQFFSDLIDKIDQIQVQDFNRIDPFRWIQLDSHYPNEYYRRLFAPLVKLIYSALKISYPQAQLMIVTFGMLDKIITLAQGQHGYSRRMQIETPFYIMVDATLKLQNCIRKLRKREWFKLQMEKKDQIDIKRRQIGDLVKRSIRQFQGQMYIVLVYKRQDKETNRFTLTFDLIPLTDTILDRRNSKKRLRVLYRYDSTVMLNIGAKNLYEYFIDWISIQEGQIQLQDQNYEVISSPTQEPNYVESDVVIPSQDKLVHIQEEEQQGYETIYNVVYSGKSSLQARRKDPLNQNTIEVSINLQNIRKLYPTLDTNDNSLMKLISKQLVEGVRLDQEGNLIVDQNKIHPSFLYISENRVTKDTIQSAIKQKDQKEFRQLFSEVLAKKTTYFKEKKLLITITYIERKIKRIISQSIDQVFEDYEVLYSITSLDLTNRMIDPLRWDLTHEEAALLSGLKEKYTIAQALLQRLVVTNDSFIFLIQRKEQISQIKHKDNHVILLPERGVKPIQKNIRNRQFNLKYKQYKAFIMKQKNKINQNFLYSSNLKSQNKEFIVLCQYGRSKQILLFAWDLETFNKYEIELPKQKYQQIMFQHQRAALRTLIQFVEFSDYLNEIYFAPPSIEDVLDIFQSQCKIQYSQVTSQVSQIKTLQSQ